MLRWSDNDHRFGPFLVAARGTGSFRTTGLVLETSREDETTRCLIRGHVMGHTLIIRLPAFIKRAREYGITVSDGFLQVFYGRQTDDSATTQAWSAFLPWTEWRCVRYRLYDRDGNLFYNDTQPPGSDVVTQYAEQLERQFVFEDVDGSVVHATTYLHEHEYRRGTGLFTWLGRLVRPRIHRRLNIAYSDEVGKEKGTWKGGVVECSAPARLSELHDAAFQRHCVTHNLTYLHVK